MELFVLFLAGMTLPGAVLSGILGLDTCRAAVSIALSLSLLVVVLAVARMAGLGTQGFGYLLLCAYGGVAGAGLWSWRRGRAPAALRFERVHAIPVAAMAAAGLYAFWAGAYTEVPADVWWHLGHINEWLEELEAGSIGQYASLESVFDKSARHWHTLAAFFLHIAGVELVQALDQIALANTLLLSAAVYSFGLLVFRNILPSPPAKHAASAAAVFFFITQFGLSVFSYARYYTFAPTMLNYIVYLAGLACFIRFLREREGGYRYLAAAAWFTIVAAAVHKQEAMFIVVMAGLILLWEYVRSARVLGPAWIVRPSSYGSDGQPRVALLLGGLVLAYVAAHGFAYSQVVRHHPLNHGVMADVNNYLPFLQNLYILKPTYQFYQVVTLWGVFVYLLFLFHIRRLLGSPYLVAGMALPFLTVFNPVFTDFFLRFSWPEVIWRLCYALPLPFVGGYLFVRSADEAVRGSRAPVRIAGVVTAVALIGLLLPFNTTFVVSPYSKIYTLAPVGPGNDHRLWSDLVGFLRERDSRGIITDPVTGYVTSSLTGHRYPGYKFFGRDGFPVDLDRYRSRDFAQRSGWLVVINRRDGAPSAAGRYGRHWPEDVMKVSNRYSDAFQSYVVNHPEQFEELWSRDRITVYLVKAS